MEKGSLYFPLLVLSISLLPHVRGVSLGRGDIGSPELKETQACCVMRSDVLGITGVKGVRLGFFLMEALICPERNATATNGILESAR